MSTNTDSTKKQIMLLAILVKKHRPGPYPNGERQAEWLQQYEHWRKHGSSTQGHIVGDFEKTLLEQGAMVLEGK